MRRAEVYGLVNCDTTRKAVKALESAGYAVDFRDVRAAPLSPAELAEFRAAFGAALVNTRSTTWRGLGPAERDGDAVALIAAHPALMKRPVIRQGATLTIGWDKAAQTAHLGRGGGAS